MSKKLNPNLIKIVNILSDGLYHDGTAIGEKLNMTRSAVWKTIKKLQEYGVKIASIKGKGYALSEPFLLLDANKIKKKLTHPQVDLTVFETVTSTNDYLKSIKHTDAIKICLAEEQRQGKGRLNRTWQSPFGKNIYLSCLFPLKKDVSELSGLSLVSSLAVIKVLKEFGVQDHIMVKWPNDVLYQQKKLSGILIEIQAESHGVSHLIMGIGLNVNMLEEESITQKWISLQKIMNKYIDRNQLVALLIDILLQYFNKFSAQGFSAFMDEWRAVDCLVQKNISLKNRDEKIKGTAMGVNASGHLLLKLKDGKVQAFSAGDASIVKE